VAQFTDVTLDGDHGRGAPDLRRERTRERTSTVTGRCPRTSADTPRAVALVEIRESQRLGCRHARCCKQLRGPRSAVRLETKEKHMGDLSMKATQPDPQAGIARDPVKETLDQLHAVRNKYTSDPLTQRWRRAFDGGHALASSTEMERLRRRFVRYEADVLEMLASWPLPEPPEPSPPETRNGRIRDAYAQARGTIARRRAERAPAPATPAECERTLDELLLAYQAFVDGVEELWGRAALLLAEVQAAARAEPLRRPRVLCWKLMYCHGLLVQVADSAADQDWLARALEQAIGDHRTALIATSAAKQPPPRGRASAREKSQAREPDETPCLAAVGAAKCA
jgi:hypothetical protein